MKNLVSLFVVATVFLGLFSLNLFWENKLLQTIEENNQQKAFHEALEEIQLIQQNLGSFPATRSYPIQSKKLLEVWALSREVQKDLMSLPLNQTPFQRIFRFLRESQTISYQLASKTASNRDLSKTEQDKLFGIYKETDEIQQELRLIQNQILHHELRFNDIDWDRQQAKNDSKAILDGFRTIEKEKRKKVIPPNVPTVTQTKNRNQALQTCQLFLERWMGGACQSIQKTSQGTYEIQVKQGASVGWMEIPPDYPMPLWVSIDRPIGKKTISLPKAREIGISNLREWGFPEYVFRETRVYGDYAYLRGIRSVNGILFPNEEFTLKLALDNGSLAGLTVSPTFFRKILVENTPMMKIIHQNMVRETTDMIPKDLQIIEKNYLIRGKNDSILEFEVIGLLHDEPYRFLFDGISLAEKDVERISIVESFYD